jgi:nucleoside-diphosphate-sugar epimerase
MDAGAVVHGLSRRVLADDSCISNHQCDITDRTRVRDVVNEVMPEYVFHLAANKSRGVNIDDFRCCYEANLFGTLNLIEACEDSPNLVQLVALGTCEEYGGFDGPYSEVMREAPVSGYSCSKAAVTQLLQTLFRTRGIPVVILRPSLAYGPYQGDEMFLPAIIRSLVSGRRFAMSRGEQTRDFIYIDDVVEALIRASLVPEANGHVINICSGDPKRIVDIARQVASLIGGDAEGLIDVGAIEYRPGEAMHYWGDRTKAKELLGWCPRVPLETGLKRTVEYYKALLDG